jgi:hypothetical protein
MNERPDTNRDPIDRLRAFDQVDVPDQWDDIVGRAAAPELAELRTTDPIDRRPRWLLAAAAATTLVVAAGVLMVANRDDEGGIAPATSPSTVPVTVPGIPESTLPATVPTSVVVDTVPSVASPPMVSSCPAAELLGAPASPPPVGSRASFGPLGLEPNLVLRLPNGPVAGTLQSGSIVRGITRIPGGVAVLFQPVDSDPAWQLVAVADDGSVLWRRCGSEQTVQLHSEGFEHDVHLREIAAGWSAWRAFDARSGQDVAPLSADPTAITLDATDRFLLLDAADSLQLVDLADGLVTDVERPEFGVEFTQYSLEDRDGGVPVIAAQEEQFGPTLAVYVDGAWRTDRDTLMAERAIVAYENSALYGPDLELGNGIHARDPLGATVWLHATEGPLTTEGFHTDVFDGGAAGDVVLSNACRQAGEADGFPTCEQPAFVALDLLTGEVLWERPSFGSVGPSGDGSVLITTDGVWELVDVRTGERLDGQLWDELTFSTFCCGEGDYVWAGSDGGVVWSVNYDTIRIYYPESLASSTTEVDLSR